MTDTDRTKAVPRPTLNAEMLVEFSAFATSKPEEMVAAHVGAIILVCAKSSDPAAALGVAIASLEIARGIALQAGPVRS